MVVRNFLTSELTPLVGCHDGVGVLRHCGLFSSRDLSSAISFVNYTVLPPGTSIGDHTHGADEELYVVLEGTGELTVDGETRSITQGDIHLNKPGGTHGLRNASQADVRVLVIGVRCGA